MSKDLWISYLADGPLTVEKLRRIVSDMERDGFGPDAEIGYSTDMRVDSKGDTAVVTHIHIFEASQRGDESP